MLCLIIEQHYKSVIPKTNILISLIDICILLSTIYIQQLNLCCSHISIKSLSAVKKIWCKKEWSTSRISWTLIYVIHIHYITYTYLFTACDSKNQICSKSFQRNYHFWSIFFPQNQWSLFFTFVLLILFLLMFTYCYSVERKHLSLI